MYAGWPGCSLEGTWDCRAAGERGGLLLPACLPAGYLACCSWVPGARSWANGTFCEPVPASGRGRFGRPLSAALRSGRIWRFVRPVVPVSARCERDQGAWLG